MKTLRLSAIAVAATLACGAASAQEVTYVEDCAQGHLLNRPCNNWFLTVQGGANMFFSKHDIHADIKNRIAPQAGLYVGKWTTPNFGFRFGANWEMLKGATTENGIYRDWKHGAINGGEWYPEKFWGIGPEFDVMINLTNWWCGYRSGRVYNAVLHGGAGAYWTFKHNQKADQTEIKWNDAHNTFLYVTAGLQNNFRVSNHVQLFLDLQFQLLNYEPAGNNGVSYTASANAGLTYNFGKTEWSCPIVAEYTPSKYTDAEGDALAARLAQAEGRIRDLQGQLDACLKRPKENQAVQQDCEGLVTIYYPINVYTLSQRDKTVLNSVAEVMQNSGKNYTLTGWADNYTGTDAINQRLRENRVNGVKTYLINRGVSDSQLNATINSGNLTDLGAKAAPLDRAVTIRESK